MKYLVLSVVVMYGLLWAIAHMPPQERWPSPLKHRRPPDR